MTPRKCRHCGTSEHPLDRERYCLDYDACIERKPLTLPAAIRLHEELDAAGLLPRPAPKGS